MRDTIHRKKVPTNDLLDTTTYGANGVMDSGVWGRGGMHHGPSRISPALTIVEVPKQHAHRHSGFPI
ncbi:MAG: hypothetical protein R6U98_34005 [Pirellulaceae bacterium]